MKLTQTILFIFLMTSAATVMPMKMGIPEFVKTGAWGAGRIITPALNFTGRHLAAAIETGTKFALGEGTAYRNIKFLAFLHFYHNLHKHTNIKHLEQIKGIKGFYLRHKALLKNARNVYWNGMSKFDKFLFLYLACGQDANPYIGKALNKSTTGAWNLFNKVCIDPIRQANSSYSQSSNQYSHRQRHINFSVKNPGASRYTGRGWRG